MCPPGYHHNSFVATHALGHMMYGLYNTVYNSAYITFYRQTLTKSNKLKIKKDCKVNLQGSNYSLTLKLVMSKMILLNHKFYSIRGKLNLSVNEMNSTLDNSKTLFV